MTAVAQIKIKADPRELPTGLRAALKMVQGFVHQTTGLMDPKKRSLDYRAIAIGSAVGSVAGNLAMRGFDMLVDQGKQVLDFNKELVRFGIDIRKLPRDMEAIGTSIRRLSDQTGLGAIDVLKAGRAYVDLAGAGAFTMEKMSLISRAAQASGADIKDMASLMFTLTENLKVPPGELEDTIGGIINQAKDGSIHFRELSHELVALGPVYKQFGVSGREGAIQLGALMQIARRGFGSASEAGTGVLRILRSIPQHASKFRAAGVQVFHDKSKTDLENFLTIIERIKKSKLSLDREKLMKAFGRTEGERFFQLLKDSSEQFDKLVVAGRENGTVMKDLGTFTESSAGRIEKAFQRMKNSVAEAFTPEHIEKFAGAVEVLASKLGTLISGVEKITSIFGKIHDFGRAIRSVVVDNEESNPWFDKSKQEEMIEAARDSDARAALRNRGINLHRAENALPADVLKAAEDRKFLRAGFSNTFNDIVKAQGGEDASPNQASIRAALLAKGSVRGPQSLGERTAAERYLAHIPQSKIEEVQNQYAKEVMAPLVESLGNRIEEAMKKNKPPSAREQAIEIQKAMDEARAMVVELDGNKLNSGLGNSPGQRRR